MYYSTDGKTFQLLDIVFQLKIPDSLKFSYDVRWSLMDWERDGIRFGNIDQVPLYMSQLTNLGALPQTLFTNGRQTWDQHVKDEGYPSSFPIL